MVIQCLRYPILMFIHYNIQFYEKFNLKYSYIIPSPTYPPKTYTLSLITLAVNEHLGSFKGAI
jgi:hypothetical protein